MYARVDRLPQLTDSFANTVSVSPQDKLRQGSHYYAHFTDEESETQRG